MNRNWNNTVAARLSLRSLFNRSESPLRPQRQSLSPLARLILSLCLGLLPTAAWAAPPLDAGADRVTANSVSVGPSFGNQPVGATSAAQAVNFTFSGSVTLNAKTPFVVLTEGVQDADFKAVKAQTTCGGTILPSGCGVAVTFSPASTGLRRGAVLLYATNGALLATAYIGGVGTGPQVVFDPGIPKGWVAPPSLDTLGAGFASLALAVDGAGNVYVVNGNAGAIEKITPAGVFSTAVAGFGHQTPEALALDGAGNIYYAQQSAVYEQVGGSPVSLITGVVSPSGLAVDAAGNVFVTDSSKNDVVKYSPATGRSAKLSIGAIAGKTLSQPQQIAVDAADTLYIYDGANFRVVKVPVTGTPSVVYSGHSPGGTIAVDANSNVYVSDYSNQTMVRVAPGGAQTPVLSGKVLGETVSTSFLAVDRFGNLYLSGDFGNAGVPTGHVIVINRTETPSLNFGQELVGAAGNATGQSFTLENIGNGTLTFPVGKGKTGIITNGYSLPVGYVLSPADTCALAYVPNAVNPKYSLAAGDECTVGVAFEPTVPGSATGNLTIFDNALNNPSAQQLVALTGSAIQKATVTLTFPQGQTLTYTGSPVTPVTATTVPAGLAVSVTYTAFSTSLISTTPPTNADIYTVTATVTQPGYVGSTTGALVIKQVVPQLSWAAPAPINSPAPITVAQLNAKANIPGTFAYAYEPLSSTSLAPLSPGTVLPQGSYTLIATFTPTDQINYAAGGQVTALLTVNPPPGQGVLTPSALNFEVAFQAGSSDQYLTLSNPGGSPLTGIVYPNTTSPQNGLTGSGAGAFTLDGNTTTCKGTTLAVGAHCQFAYYISSSTPAGTYSATFSIGTPAGTLTATLAAVVYPVPTFGPANVTSIEDTPINTASAPFTLTLSNTTAAPLNLTSTGVTGGSSSDYHYTSATTCPTTFPAALPAATPAGPTTCNWVMTFTPTTANDTRSVFNVNGTYSTPAPLGSQPLSFQTNLYGSTAPVPTITQIPNAPANLTFAAQTAGTTSFAQTVQVNVSDSYQTVVLSAPTFSGTGGNEFLAAVNCNAGVVAPNGSVTLANGISGTCTYSIQFAPVAGGPSTVNATMTISSAQSPQETATFNLSATALNPFTGRVVWIPDFEGQLVQVEAGTGGNAKAITLKLPTTCNPTSVTASLAYAFVLCSSAAGNADELLVYDANIIRNAPTGTITPTPTPLETWPQAPYSMSGTLLIAGALDSQGNYWYASQGDSSIYELPASYIASGNLNKSFYPGGPVDALGLNYINLGGAHNRNLVPTGIALAADGSIWVSGSQYNGDASPATGLYGMVINVPASQFGKFGPNPHTFYCLTTDPNEPSCFVYSGPSGSFTNPGGVAIFNNTLWVSITGGVVNGTNSAPGREIVGFPITPAPTGDTLGTAVTFGSAASPTSSPFVCPGGLFAQTSNAIHLWINDDGYGDSNKSPSCGGAGDTASQIGAIFSYTATQLSSHDTTLTDVQPYTNVTGRPGMGGIFVESDQ